MKPAGQRRSRAKGAQQPLNPSFIPPVIGGQEQSRLMNKHLLINCVDQVHHLPDTACNTGFSKASDVLHFEQVAFREAAEWCVGLDVEEKVPGRVDLAHFEPIRDGARCH